MSTNIPEIYSKFNTWSDNNSKIIAYKNTNTSEQLAQNQEYQDLANSTPSIFNINDNGVTQFFDSVENFFGMDKEKETFLDKTANFINGLFGTYDKQIEKLGEGELLEKDKDGSGALSMDEYIEAEMADLGDSASLEDKAYVETYSQFLFQILDEGTSNSDKNGELNAKELSSHYKNVDRFENDELKDEGNGSFSVDEAADFTTFLVDNMFSPETVNQLYELNLKKQQLQ